jgi:hypothetical protein
MSTTPQKSARANRVRRLAGQVRRGDVARALLELEKQFGKKQPKLAHGGKS